MSAYRLLPLAAAIGLACQVVAAKPYCENPSVDAQLNISVPCVQFDGAPFRATLGFRAPSHWVLEDFAPAEDCAPTAAACATAVDSEKNIAFDGVEVLGLRHAARLKFNSTVATGNGMGWDLDDYQPKAGVAGAGKINVRESLKEISFKGGKKLNLDVGIGSGAFHMPGDAPDIFYTITDRGPNIGCEEAPNLLGASKFCIKTDGSNDEAGKIFPVPEFTPSIYKIRLTSGATGNPERGRSYEILEQIKLQDRNGQPITGLSNPLKAATTELGFDPQGAQRGFDAEGLDTEALVRLKDGTFWLADEYGPSLIHVAADGKIITRLVPAGLEADLAAAEYNVEGKLPSIFKKRTLNRGAEAIAISPDEKYLYFIMQSPLANPDAAAYKASRNVRLVKIELDNGNFKALAGEYLYVMDLPEFYPLDNSTKQTDVKVSELVALANGDLLVLERISKQTKLYRVRLDSKATNLLGGKWDDEGTAPTLEQTAFLAGSEGTVVPLRKELAFDSLHDLPNAPAKIEGVAILDHEYLALINDNDFGIAGDQTTIVVAKLSNKVAAGAAKSEIMLKRIGRYQTGFYDAGGSEIVAYCAMAKRVFVVNAADATVDVLDVADPAKPTKIGTLDVKALGASANSVAAKNGKVAVAVENANKQAPGKIALFDANTLALLNTFDAGALPDMVTFTADGKKILVANEGEPDSDYTNDPEGSITLIDVASGAVQQLKFDGFNAKKAELMQKGVRVFSPNATVAQDLEPEYIATSADSKTAWVTLQENNALAVVDIASATITDLLPLGFKDHNQGGNELDPTDKDGKAQLGKWPVLGMYLPDSIAAFTAKDGNTYLVTANEGDSRDYAKFSEEKRVKDVVLDATAFPTAANLQQEAQLGRLKITSTLGDSDGDGDYDKLYAFGGRSFSIWNSQGEQVFDSGSQFAKLLLNQLPANFNDDSGKADGRSDDKGSEPEAIAVGEVNGQTYAFIGLERMGGIMVYNITDPKNAYFVTYLNDRDFSVMPGKDNASVPGKDAGDLAPEGLSFVSAAVSPNGQPLLIAGNEVSGTTAIYQIFSDDRQYLFGATKPKTNIAPPTNGSGNRRRLDMRILHINDHHSHLKPNTGLSLNFNGVATQVEMGGFARVAATFNSIAADYQGNLLKLHAGDALTGDLYYTLFKGEADAALMNQVCFDAFALGNHEFDGGDAGLKTFLDYLNVNSPCGATPVLAANVIPQVGTPLAAKTTQDYLKPYIVREFEGEKVGIIGIDIVGKTQNSSKPLPTTEFRDEAQTAQQYIDKLTQEGINKIILMTHYGYQNDLALAQKLHGVDVIIGGDSHTLLGSNTMSTLGLTPDGPYPTQVKDTAGNPVCIGQAWQYAQAVGDMKVSFTPEGVVDSCDGITRIMLGNTFKQKDAAGAQQAANGANLEAIQKVITASPEFAMVTPDAKAQAVVEQYSSKVDAMKATEIGKVAETLCLERIPGQGYSKSCDAASVRAHGSDISNLVAKAFLAQSLRADISIQNAGGVRVDIAAGTITTGDAYVLLPFANTLVNLDMTGAQIVAVLEDAFDYAIAKDGSTGAYPYAAGLRWDVDRSKPKGQRFSNVEVKGKKDSTWSPIDLNKTYVVVTNDYTASGKDGYATFGTVYKDPTKVENTYLDYAQSFVDYVKVQGTLRKLPVEEYSTQKYYNETGQLQQ